MAMELVQSNEEFPIDFNVAWQWIEYSRKDVAKEHFMRCNFLKGMDYGIYRTSQENSNGGRPTEKILLTVDCFKMWCMLANTEKGKQVRMYFLECERIAKKTVAATVKVIEISPEAKLEMAEKSLGMLKLLCGENLEGLAYRDKMMYVSAINNANREVLYGSEPLLDPDERPLSITEIAQAVYGVRMRPGSKVGCDAHLGRIIVKRWQQKYNFAPDVKPDRTDKFMTRHHRTTQATCTGHDIQGVYVYPKEDWHIVGETLVEHGYKIKQSEEFLLNAAS